MEERLAIFGPSSKTAGAERLWQRAGMVGDKPQNHLPIWQALLRCLDAVNPGTIPTSPESHLLTISQCRLHVPTQSLFRRKHASDYVILIETYSLSCLTRPRNGVTLHCVTRQRARCT